MSAIETVGVVYYGICPRCKTPTTRFGRNECRVESADHTMLHTPLRCMQLAQRIRRRVQAKIEFQPFVVGYELDPLFDKPEPVLDYAPYVRLAVCKHHGLEAVTGEKSYHTGTDPGIAGMFSCGMIVEEDVF